MKVLLWIAAVVCFVAGFAVGMLVNASLGVALWGLSFVLALAPFASHRNKQR